MAPAGRILLAACLLGPSTAPVAAAEFVEVTVDPPAVRLHGPGARYSILITGRTADGRLVDRTHAARYEVVDPRVARVTSAGVVLAVGDGKTTVKVRQRGACGTWPSPSRAVTGRAASTSPTTSNRS
jgi:hypothetical protein